MRRLLTLMICVLAAGCTDSATGPIPTTGGPVLDESTMGCVSDGSCPLDPVIVIGAPGGSGGAGGGGSGGGSDNDGDPYRQCITSYNGDATIQNCGGGTRTPSDPPPPPPPDDSECDPRTDPDCEQPLTSADSTALQIALRDYVRPAAEIADTTARRQCAEMLNQFNASYAAGRVFRGGTNTTHYGATYLARIHFDPRYLDGAAAGNATMLREIANTALHEAAHVLGYDHPTAPTWVGTQDYYSDVPFNLLSPGTNSCIRY